MSSAQCDNMPATLRQEDLVHDAVMAELRAKELDLSILSKERQILVQQQQITKQTNLHLMSQIDLHFKEVAGKDMLEQR